MLAHAVIPELGRLTQEDQMFKIGWYKIVRLCSKFLLRRIFKPYMCPVSTIIIKLEILKYIKKSNFLKFLWNYNYLISQYLEYNHVKGASFNICFSDFHNIG